MRVVRCFSLLSGIVSILTLASPSLAQEETEVDAQRFKPAVTYDGWVTAEGSGVRPTQDPLELGLYLNYGWNPLVNVEEDNEIDHQFVAGVLGIDLLASLTLAGPFALGVGLPLYLFQSGDSSAGVGDGGEPSFGGLGDVRLVPKLRLLDDRESVGLALALELRAPTHTGDYNGGARNIQGIPKIIIDHRWISGVRFGANLGVAIRESTDFFNVHAGSEFMYAVALGYTFGGIEGNTELGGELAGGVGLSEQDAEEVPLEGFVFLRHRPSEEWSIQGGPGIGILPGYGVPTFRIFAGVRYTPTSHDRDGDGIQDEDDKCPDTREDRDGIEDTDGCPEEDPDTDKDGVPDSEDECPQEKETINGVDDEDGCPDSGDPRVVYEDGKFMIMDTIQFEHNSAEIKEESHGLLDQVALTMKANPEVKKVRVEGHTDDTGPENTNLRLSKARAHAVRNYLIKKGVDGRRLSAEGYGEEKPLVKGTSDADRAKNRRVEFVVE